MSMVMRTLLIPVIWLALLIQRWFFPSFREIEAAGLGSRLGKLKIRHVLIDMRTADDFARGTFRQATNIPLDTPDTLAQLRDYRRLDGLLIVFDGDGSRTAEIQRLTRRARIGAVQMIRGGWQALESAGEV